MHDKKKKIICQTIIRRCRKEITTKQQILYHRVRLIQLVDDSEVAYEVSCKSNFG